MIFVETEAKKWGNSSLAFVIPRNIVVEKRLKNNQKIRLLLIEDRNPLKETFGLLKAWKKPTDRIMREIDEELWNE